MARSAMAVFEARRKIVDAELSALTEENDNIERLIEQLQRRKEIAEGRWELLIAERDFLDDRIWQGQRENLLRLGPRPPRVRSQGPRAPRDLASEPWDIEALEAALAS